jgi:hypothetical protein
MEIFIAIVLILLVAGIGYAAYCGVRVGNRLRRSAKDYLNS